MVNPTDKNSVKGPLPKSFFGGTSYTSPNLFMNFPNEMGTRRARPSNELTTLDLGNTSSRCTPAYQTSTGPLGTGMDSRVAAAGSCMKDATIGPGR